MNVAPLVCLSPAKLNLFLHITGRRADGYHELQTVFQLTDLCDSLEFLIPSGTPPGTLSLRCDDPAVPLQGNLVLRAAERLRKAGNCPAASADIYLKKRIPMGAGLGGGSSNAAITLLALNELWRLGLSREQLSQLAVGIGADVPLFIHGYSAWATGVGEILAPLELPQRYYLIIWPGISVSTAQIFSQEKLTRDSSAIKIADFLAGGGRNDCEPVVRNLYPPVDEALNWLAQYGSARLTGTGSAIFSSFETMAEAERVLSKVPRKFKGIVARGINHIDSLTGRNL